MKKNLFERFCKRNGVSDDTNEKQNTKKKEKTFKDGIAKQNDLPEKILFILRSNYSGLQSNSSRQQISFNNKILTVWIRDGFYDSIIESDFKKNLDTSINKEFGVTFKTIEIKSGKVPEKVAFTEVDTNVFLQISTIEKQNPQGKEEIFKNGIEKQSDLLEKILSRLQSKYSGQQILFNNEVLTIWIRDGLFYDSIIESDFKKNLDTSINKEFGVTFKTIEIKSGKVPEKIAFTEVDTNVFLQISTIEKQNTKKKEKTFKDGIAKQSDLSEKILSELRSNYLGQHIPFNNKVLTIWIQDGLFYDSIIESDFKEKLIVNINTELGVTFKDIRIESGKPPKKAVPTPTKVGSGDSVAFLQISNRSTINTGQQVITKAKICPFDKGSTSKAEYVLDSQKIRKMPGERYNIGRGSKPIMPDGSPRENHIVIIDNPKNQYVSRAHAYITYSEEYGFLLYTEKKHKGNRVSTPTCIIRGSESIELNDTSHPAPLKYGDYIVLNNCVNLLFQKV